MPAKDFLVPIFQSLVKSGLELLNTANHSDEDIKKWIDYSIDMVGLSTRDDNQLVFSNYLQLVVQLRAQNLSNTKQMLACMSFLLEVSKKLMG